MQLELYAFPYNRSHPPGAARDCYPHTYTMSTILSEKAKGKQRAVDPPPETPPLKDLTIRFTEGIPDLMVQVAEKDTVKDVKRNVRVMLASTHMRC